MSAKEEPGTPTKAVKHALIVRGGTGEEDITIKVKGGTKFKKIYDAIAKAKGMAPKSFSLTYDGDRINDEDTPESLEMEEEVQIDLQLAQVGGSLQRRPQRRVKLEEGVAA